MTAQGKLMETAGAVMIALLVIIAISAPLLAPHDPARAVAATFGDPAGPSRAFPLVPTNSAATSCHVLSGAPVFRSRWR